MKRQNYAWRYFSLFGSQGNRKCLDMRCFNAYLQAINIQEQSMAYDIRLMKLVTGELVIGKYDAEKDCLNDVAAIQSIPTQQGVQ